MNAPTDWVSAIAILAAGLILGLLFVLFFGKKKAATLGGETDLDLKDLHAKRDALVQQLRDPGLSPDERNRLELETAAVLRQLATHSPLPAGRVEGQGEGQKIVTSSPMNPALKGFLWGAGSFAALAALGYLVMQSSNPREQGGSVTGGFDAQAQQQQAQAPAPPDAALQQILAAVQSNPNDLALRNDLAQAYLERDNLMAVFEQTKFVLDKSPEDSRALTYQALVRMAMGEGAEAENMLERAAKSDPKNLDAWVARAWVYAQAKKLDEAEQMIAEATKQSPENKERLEEVLRQMKANAANPAPAAQELPAGHPPIADAAPAVASAAPAPAAAPTGPSINVTIDVEPSARNKTGVLYVMARNPAGGPPVAVKRLQVTAFPVSFPFGAADSMMGQPLPAKFRLEARLDSDGDAATKLPTDPTAMQADVVPGATVKLALK
jgi:tetratricopeptide (TPR) repeat protein